MVAKGRTRSKSIPSPVGGWNTRDSLDEMEDTDAILLDNWIPGAGKCYLRDGYAEHSDSSETGHEVETLVEYHAGSVQKLIGAVNGKVYDFSSGTPSSLGTGYSNDRWQFTNFAGYLIGVNGADTPKQYDGTTWGDNTWTGTGLTPANLDGILAHKHRLYLWDSSTQSFWYGGVDQVSGTLTEFPLGRVTQLGGNLLTAGSLSVDTGEGIDDYVAFIMSSGQVVVYSGDDPGTATKWAIDGVFDIGEPINIRGIIGVAGDLFIITKDDYVSLKDMLKKGYLGSYSKLSGAVQQATQANSSGFGWGCVLHPAQNLLIFNVPQTDGSYHQHVINTVTKAPCRFTGINAHCWARYDGNLYFGGDDGVVYQYTGDLDGSSHITGDAKQSWNSLGVDNSKNMKLTRPVLSASGDVSYSLGLGFDYKDVSVSSPSTIEQSGAVWDVAEWDVAEWSNDNVVSTQWRVSGGMGQMVSPRIKVNSKVALSWLRTDYRFEVGKNL